MEIILSSRCESLTGSLGQGFGYFIVCRKDRYYSVRSKHHVPPDGHWRFILACTALAQNGLHISDVSVHWMELSDALYEAGHFVANRQVRKNGVEAVKMTYHAADIINLKHTFGL